MTTGDTIILQNLFVADKANLNHLTLLLGGLGLVVLIQHLIRPDVLRDVPGPWLAKYTSLLLAYHTRGGKRYLYVDSLHKKYGPVVRITPSQVSCSAPNAPATIYAQGAASLPKTPFYRAFYVSGTPSLFSTQDRAGHASKRRLLAHPFSYTSVRDFEGWMRVSLGKFVRGLDKFCVPAVHKKGLNEGAETPGRASGSGAWVDVLLWLNYMAFDVISDLAFGEPLGMLDRESDVLTPEGSSTKDEHGVADMIDYRGRTAAFLGLFPSILPPSPLSTFFMFLLRKVIPDPFVSRGLNSTESLSRIAQRCVKDRLRAGEEGRRGDLLDRLVEGMKSQDKGDDDDVTEEDIVTEAMLLLTAGSDTTANSTAAILFHILKNPNAYRALREELDGLVESGGIEEGDDGLTLPSHDRVKNLKYLQATIDEGLRMFATNAFGLPRVVPPDSAVELSGWTFREGTELSSPAYSIQHDPTIWGDPEVFRPERWLEGKDIKRHLLTFGIGPRACIGKNLAYMQMQIVLATVLLRYDFELRDEKLESVEGFMHKPVDLWVRMTRRGTSV